MAGVKKINTYPKHYFLSLAAKASILLVFIIGLIYFLSGTGLINKITPQLPQTQVITSVLLMLSSISLWIFQKDNQFSRNILRVAGVVVLVVSLITLPTYLWGNEPSRFYYPHRMALITTIVFLFLGVIFILFGNNSRRQDGIAHVLFFPAAILSYFGLTSYILKVYDVFQIGLLNMAPGAALSLFLLCLTILFLKPDTWLMRIFSGTGPGSIMGRRLLPWLLILPVVGAWLRIEADLYGYLPSQGMLILMAIVYTLIFLFLVWLSAWSVNRIDRSRRSAEEAMRESEARLRALITATSDAVYRMSPDWRQIYDLQGGAFLTSVESPTGDWLNSYIPEDSQPVVLDAINKAINSKTKFELEHEVRRADGTIGWILSSAIPLLDDKGEIVEWYGIASDFTERKRAAEALRKSESRMRALLSATSNSIYRMDPEGKTVSFLSGELYNSLSSPFRAGEYIPEDDIPEVLDTIENAIKSKSLFEIEHQVILTDGSVRWTHSRAIPILNDQGEIEEWFGFAHDITERKKAVEALKESEQRWITTLASIGDGVVATDMEGKITFMNREAEKLTGWDHLQALGEPLNHVLNILNDQHSEPHTRIKKGNVFKYNTHNILRNKSGKEIPVEFKFTPIVTEDGRQKGNVSILHDVSQRKRVENLIKNYGRHLEEKVKRRTAQLETARERAESADRLKTSFLLNMSHELRTPLNSIIGFSGILLKGLAGPLNPEQEKQLEMVQKSGRHLLSLINDIIDISKIDAGELKPHFETFNFQDMIEDVKNLLQPFADSKGLDIRFIKDLIGEIESDKKRLKQIFINVINNAIKFTEKGSVTITCRSDNDYIVTDVSDTGIGIREEDFENLFNPFIQLENSFTRKFEGSGLGLSISKKLLEMLHGSITVKSELGVGSTFTITLRHCY